MEKKEFDFNDFQKAWDAQEEVFENMDLIHKDEIQKMINGSTIEKEPIPHKSIQRLWMWKGAAAACIVMVLVTMVISLFRLSPLPSHKIDIAQQDILNETYQNIESQTDIQSHNDPLNMDLQTDPRSLSTTNAENDNSLLILNKTNYGRHSSTTTENQTSVMTQNEYLEPSESGVGSQTSPEAYQTIRANEIKNYGHDISIISNRKCNATKIVNQLQELL